jgi:hypothetical protein
MTSPTISRLLPFFTPDRIVEGVNNEIPSILLFMDQTIEKKEEELARLRRARAELAAAPDRRRLKRPAPTQVATPDDSADSSIGKLLMEALRQNGSLTVKQIHEWVLASGKIAQYHTVSSMVGYYNKKKYIKRLSHGIYAIAEEPRAKGAPKPELTNGAPLPRNGTP